MLRKLHWLLLGLVLAGSTWAQTIATVTATVTDPNNVPYSGATGTAIWVPPAGSTAPPTITATGLPFTQTNVTLGTLSATGSFSVQLMETTSISPPGSTWKFAITSNSASAPAVGFTTAGVAITTSPQSVTSTLTAASVKLGEQPISALTTNFFDEGYFQDMAPYNPTVLPLGTKIRVFNTGTGVLGCLTSTGANCNPGGAGAISSITFLPPLTGGTFTSGPAVGGWQPGSACAPGSFSTGLDALANSLCSVPPITPPSPSPYVGPTALNGCGVEWTGLLNFTVGQCTYIINGVTYTTPITPLTLTTADPTNPRIDAFYTDVTPVANFLTGTPAASPVAPTVDPSTQLGLAFVEVAASATTPTGVTKIDIYHENTEWTTATGGTNSARVALASTNFPYDGSVDIEFGVGGTVTTTTYAQATDPASGTVDLAGSNALVFYIRSKATWPANRSVTIQWFNGATAKGTPIVLSNGNFGFTSALTTGYQQIVIPTSYFGINGIPVTTVRFTVSGTGAALTGFYLDDITLQAGIGPPILPASLMNFRGTYNPSVNYNPNDVVINNGLLYVALSANLNVPVSTTATWAGINACANALTGQLFTAQNGAAPQCVSPGVSGRTVAGTSDTILGDSGSALRDRDTTIQYTSGSATAVTLGQAGSSGFGSNFTFSAIAAGAGTVTITPTTSTITYCNGVSCTSGASSLALTTGQYATISSPDNTSYLARIVGGGSGGSVTSVVIAGTANQIAVSGTCTITTTGTCTLAFPSSIVIPNGSTGAGSLLVAGVLDGLAHVVIDTSTPVTVGTTYLSGYHFNQNATAATAVTYNLPTAAAGIQKCFKNSYNGSAGNTGTLTIQTSASGQYLISVGVLSASGGYIISGGALGDAACVVGIDSTHWSFYQQSGVWTLH